MRYIEFRRQDGSESADYHLMNGDVPAGEYYASNPTDVSDLPEDHGQQPARRLSVN